MQICMGTISKRQQKDKTIRYRAQVRFKYEGKPPISLSKTFSKKSLAEEWIKRTESDFERNPQNFFNPNETKQKSLRDLINRYLEEADTFARSKTHALKTIASLELSEKNIYSLKRQDFSEFAIYRKNGDPITGSLGVAPATILKDLSHIKAVLVHAEYVWGEQLEDVIVEYEKALIGLRKSRIVTRSKTRDRLPTAEELQTLTNYFYKQWRRVKAATPMHMIMWFAIYTARRENELCHMLLSDYDERNSQWLIRDVKNPDGSAGNHKYAHLEPDAVELIHEFLDPDTRRRILNLGYDKNLLIPVNAKTVSTYFTRACHACGIEDLRFHDLRHEGATRYAEQGFSIPKLQTITLHESWNTLKRYVNLKKRGAILEYTNAIKIAEQEYNSFYKDWSKTQRYVAKIDEDTLPDIPPEKIELPFECLKPVIEKFINVYKDNKYFKRMHIKKLKSQNPFAFNNEKAQFYAHDIQMMWQDWLIQQSDLYALKLPKGTTHFSVNELIAIKQTESKTYIWDCEHELWIDTFNGYEINENLSIAI